MLLLDGVDDVAAERAAPHADPAALDALLAGLDDQPLPVLCTAERSRGLDRALLRRFVATVGLRTLDQAGALGAFHHLLGCEPPGMLPEGLTLGDLAAVRHRREVLGGDADPRALAAWLVERAEANGADFVGSLASAGTKTKGPSPRTRSAVRRACAPPEAAGRRGPTCRAAVQPTMVAR